MSIIDSYQKIVESELRQLGFDISHLKTLDDYAMNHAHAILHLNIKKNKRHIFISKEFNCPPKYKNGLENLIKNIENGNNVNCYLSKLTSNLNHFDKLLFDWGIHHFHLGEGLEPNSLWIQRTSDILFVIIREEDCFFIQIMDHKSWTNIDLLNIIDDNFGELLDSYTMLGVDLEVNLNSEDIKNLRNANINTAIKLNSNRIVIGMGGGISSAGTSTNTRVSADEILYYLESLENTLGSDYEYRLNSNFGYYQLSDRNDNFIPGYKKFYSLIY